MSKVTGALRYSYVMLGVAAYALKAWADYSKHKHDGPHSQRCDCFYGCLPCQIEAVRN